MFSLVGKATELLNNEATYMAGILFWYSESDLKRTKDIILCQVYTV